jgi:Na+/H+-dicarboxylate symporter
MSLTKRIILAMVLGIVVGATIHIIPALDETHVLYRWVVDGLFDAVGQIFIASLMLLVVPLVFVSLVCGSATLGGDSRMGVMALKTVGLYLLTTALAITLALSLASVLGPGKGVELAIPEAIQAPSVEAPSIKDTLINIMPRNPINAMAEGNMLQVIVFALLLGIAIAHTGGQSSRYLLEFFNHLNAVIMKLVMILMHLAPYGVFCLLAKLFSELGWGTVTDLGFYFAVVLLALLLHALGVYSVLLKLLTGLSPITFLRKLEPVMVFGFSTASSNATLPVTLRTAEKELGVDNKVASFSVPLGATINMDGTAIMQGVATVFIAQVYGIDIGLAGYLMVVLTATLASIGTAGVPGVGMITLAMVLQQAGLPVEGIALIIGVDRLLDMVRTAVNVTGDAMVTTVVANSEKLLDRETFASPANNEQ